MTDSSGPAAAFRTPESRFAGLPDFDYEPHYREYEGLRLAYLDEGDGPPVVFFHGEPTWSFLWRNVFPAVRDAGFRCLVPDHVGFGRSDKPTDVDWYTYDRHIEYAASFFEQLNLRDVTLVVHDWGGPIGLRIAAEHPEWVTRLVICDTGLFTGHTPMNDAWHAFRDFVARSEDLPVGFLVKGACLNDPGETVIAAYDAPFPTPESKAGAKAFPLLIPEKPDEPGAAEGAAALKRLIAEPRPTKLIWGRHDPVVPIGKAGERLAEVLGVDPPLPLEASHFLQEDAGPELGRLIAEWLTA